MATTPQERSWARPRDIIGLLVLAGLVTWSGVFLADQNLLSGFILIAWLLGPVGLLASLWFVMRRWRSSYRPTDFGLKMQEFGTLLAVGGLSTYAAVGNLVFAIGDHNNIRIWMAVAYLAGAVGLGVLGIIRMLRWRANRRDHLGGVEER